MTQYSIHQRYLIISIEKQDTAQNNFQPCFNSAYALAERLPLKYSQTVKHLTEHEVKIKVQYTPLFDINVSVLISGKTDSTCWGFGESFRVFIYIDEVIRSRELLRITE